MRIVLLVVGGLVVSAGLALLAGWLLPATREGRAGILVNAPPARILAVIADVEAQPEWRTGLASVSRDGNGWIETTARGERIRFEPVGMTEARIHLRFTSSAGYSGEWLAELTAQTGGTHVAVVERATVPSPIGRILSRLFFDPEAFATTYLQALKARSEDE